MLSVEWWGGVATIATAGTAGGGWIGRKIARLTAQVHDGQAKVAALTARWLDEQDDDIAELLDLNANHEIRIARIEDRLEIVLPRQPQIRRRPRNSRAYDVIEAGLDTPLIHQGPGDSDAGSSRGTA